MLLKRITKENDPIKKDNLYATYKDIRNVATRNNSKTLYFSQFFEKRAKSSDIWKGIRSVVNVKSSRNNNINLLDKNNDLIKD